MILTSWLEQFRRRMWFQSLFGKRRGRRRRQVPRRMRMQTDTFEPRVLLSAAAISDTLVARSDQPTVVINALENDTTDDGPLQIVSITQPSIGNVQIVEGNLENGGTVADRLLLRDLPENFTGVVTFSYTVEDDGEDQDTAEVSVRFLEGTQVSPPVDTLTGWTVVESGGGANEGSVTVDDGDIFLEEGDSFVVALEREVVIPANPGSLVFEFEATFDTTDPSSINDAFEVALVDGQGRPVIPIVRPGRDTFFNLTEQEDPALGTKTMITGQTVTLDLSSLQAGETYRLIFRLVNNDSDTGTTVRLIGENHIPAAAGDLYTTIKNQAININVAGGVLANDEDEEGDAFTTQLIQGPQHGTLTLNANGSFTYTPTTGFVGTDTFTYAAVETGSGRASLPAIVAIQVGPDSVVIPGEPGTLQVVTLAIEAVNLEASYRNELGMYLVDDADGRVNGLLPGQAGYAQAALSDPTRQIVFARPADNEDLVGQQYQVVLPAGTRVAFYLIQNNTTANFLANNPSNSGGGSPVAFFSFGAADPDSFQHFRTTVMPDGRLLYQVEDLTGGGDQDYNDLQFAINAEPTEVTGPIKFFVVDAESDRVYEYNPDGYWVGQPELNASNGTGRGITTNATGTRRWVVDENGRVFMYDAEMTLLGDWQASGITEAAGIGTDGTDIWIVDEDGDDVYFFDGGAALTTGTITATSSFSLNGQNTTASDLATDGTTIWVTDSGQNKVYVYNTSGTLQGSWQLDAANGDASGITHDPTGTSDDLWVVDRVDRIVYRYADGTLRTTSSGAVTASGTFALATSNTAPEGIADPLTVTVNNPSGTANPNGTIVISGQAISSSGTVTRVTVNGIPGVVDAAGNFFAEVPVSPGENTYTVYGEDSASQTDSTTVNVVGAAPSSGIDFSIVVPAASVGIVAEYGQTSFNDRTNILYADVALRNDGTFPVSGPILIGVRNLSAPTVSVVGADGWTPDGIPYYDVSDLAGPDGILTPEELSSEFSLRFHNPDGVRFTYELVIFAAVNQPPRFTTVPVVEAIVEAEYVYDSDAADPDNDTLTYSLLSGPSGLSIDANGRLTWSPDSGDEGNHSVTIRVIDGRGGEDLQSFVITVRDGVPNRPPRFTSTPVVDAYVNVEYEYPSTATDPDQDTLTYSLVDGPDGMTIDEETGEISWTPPADMVGETVSVTIRVDDGNGASGGGTADQTYLVYVHPEPANSAPVIISQPGTNHIVSDFVGPSDGDVDPISIDLELGDGETDERTVTITLPLPGTTAGPAFADIILIVDESGSMEEQSWIADMVLELEAALVAAGIGTTVGYPNRFGLVGFGASDPTPRTIYLGSTPAKFGTATELAAEVDQLEVSGGEEDGYAGIEYALSNYTFRQGAAVNVILVTDEDRDDLGGDSLPTYQNILDDLTAAGALLNVVVNADFNVLPRAILTGSSSIAAYGSVSLYAGSSYDPAGGTIASYSWDLNGDGVYGDGGYTSSTLSLNWSQLATYGFETGDSFVVSVKVTDSEGKTDTAKRAINVADDVAPLAVLSGPAQIAVYGSAYLYANSSSDPDGGSLTYSWDLNGDGTYGDGSYTSNTLSLNWSQLASYGFAANSTRTVSVKVTDNEGDTDTAEFAITVGPTSDPIAVLSGAAQIAVYGSVYLYANSSSDPDGGSISSYTWDLNGDGVYGDGGYTSSTLSLNWSQLTSYGFTADSTRTVSVKVTDNEGEIDTAEYSITVGPTIDPIAVLTGPALISVYGSVYLYANSSSDPDGGSLSSYTWDLNGDGTYGDGSFTSSTLSLNWTQLSSYGFTADSTRTVSVKVTDNEGETDTAEFAITVGPTIDPIAVLTGPALIAAYGSVNLYANSSSDPDGGSLSSYTWDLNGDGTYGDGSFTSSTLSLNWTQLSSYGFTAGSTRTVSVKVTDNEGETDTAEFAITVGPTIDPIARLSGPSTIAPSGSVSLSATSSSDPDGGSISSYTWDLNGDGVFGDGSYTSSTVSLNWTQLTSYGFTAGDSVTVAVKVTDNESETAIAEWTINVGVSSPLVIAAFDEYSGTAFINPGEGFSIEAGYYSYDPDGGSVTYTWDLNGDGTFGDGSITSSYLSLSWSQLQSYGFTAGESGTIAVKVKDDENDTAIAVWSLNVGPTSPPVLYYEEYYFPTSITAHSSLSVDAGYAYDPDGGSVTYSWDLNGDGTFGDGSITSSSLSLTWSQLLSYGFAVGESSPIMLKLTDNEGETTTIRWMINVGPTSPPVLYYEEYYFPTSISAHSSLSVDAGYAYDPDGGSVSYSWDLNGDGTFGDGSITSSSLSLTWSQLLSYGFAVGESSPITLKLTDNEGETTTIRWMINVGPTSPPVIYFDEYYFPTTLAANSSLSTDSVYAYDPDGGSVSYSWDLNGDGTFGDGSITSSSLSLTWSQLLSYGFAVGESSPITLKVTDNEGETTTVRWTINVGVTSPPVIYFDEYYFPTTLAANSSLSTDSVYAYDPDGGSVGYSWDLNGDGTFGDGSITSSSLSLTWSQLLSYGFAVGESSPITLKVTDNEGETTTVRWMINVGPTSPPVIYFEEYETPSEIDFGSGVGLSVGYAYDPDGGSISYSWDLDNDGTFGDGSFTSSSLSLTWSQLLSYGDLQDGTFLIRVKATDNEGETTTALWAINVNAVSSASAVGQDSEGVLYLADGSGGFIEGTATGDLIGSENTVPDYVDLAFETGGAAWNILRLRQNGLMAESFTNAFVEVKKDEILQQVAQIDVNLVASDENGQFVNLTGLLEDVLLGTEVEFDVRLTGTGQGQAYEIQFVQEGTGIVLGSIPVTINNDYFYLVQAVDPDGDPLTYTLVSGPDGAIMDPDTSRVHWDPTEAGDYEFLVRVEDGRGGVDEQLFVVHVTDSGAGNHAPTIEAIPDFEGQTGRPFEHQVVAEDEDGDTLRYYLTDAPEGMTIDVDTGLIRWTPAIGQENLEHAVTVKVVDRRGGADTETFEIAVEPATQFVNAPPQITSAAPTSGVEGGAFHYSAAAFDADGDGLTWSLTLGPDGAGIDPQTGDVVWTPPAGQVGEYAFAIQVRDSHGGVDYQYFTVTIVSSNAPPQITSTPTGPVRVSEPWSYQVVATDPNGDLLTYRLNPASVVGNMALDAETGLLTWTPTATGSYRIELAVEDGRGGFDVQSFTIDVAVAPSNDPPRITTEPDGPAILGEVYTYTIGVTEPDGDTYTIALDDVSLARGISLVSGNVLTWTPTSLGDFEITVTVTDEHGAWTTQRFTLPVRAAVVESAPPVITSQPTGPAYVGQAWTYVVTATDPDTDFEDLVFTLEDPTGNAQVDWDPDTQTLTWTPLSGDIGVGESFTIQVADPSGSWVSQTFTVPVEAAPPSGQPPVITSIPTGPALVHQPYQYQVVAHDPDGGTLEYSLVSPPPGVEIDVDTGLLTVTPSATGNLSIEIRVDDGIDGYATQTFTLPVVNPAAPGANLPPEITSRPTGPAYVGEDWTYVFTAIDPDGDESEIEYSLVTPTGNGTVDFDPETSTLTWSPSGTGSLTFTLRAEDEDGAYVDQTFTIPAVASAPANVPPRIRSLPPNPIRLGDLYAYQVDAYDPSGDTLTYSLQTAPVGMSIDPATGLVTWNPSATGAASVVIAVSDGVNSPVLQSFTLNVIAPVKLNDPPTITSQPTGPAVRDREYHYQATATDPDGDTIVWSLDQDSIDRGITINAATGLLAWTPTAAGSVTIVVTADDQHGGAQTQTFTLTVLQNAPPVITSGAVTQVDLGDDYTYDVSAVDPNTGDTLTYSLADAPGGMTIDEETGEIEWTPSAAGSYVVTVVVKDQDGAEGRQSYTVRVTDPLSNTPPVIHSVIRGQIQVGQPLVHQIDATDADGDLLTYGLVDAPAGMTVDSAGLIRWTPTAAQAGSSYTFTVQVNDNRVGGLVEEEYTIAVVSQPVNNPPTFTTEPGASAVAGTRYVYDANANDPDGDTLIYSLVSPPAGMTIDPLTGLVSWTPSIQQVGPHTLTVRVMDPFGRGAEQTVTLTVRPVNRPPMLTGDPPTTAISGEQLVFQVPASDPDGHRLTYSLGAGTTASGSISINSTTGVLTWTPSTTGPQFVQVNIVDELGLGIAAVFRVEVLATRPNTGPVITNAPTQQAPINGTWSWDINAFDPDPLDTVTFSLVSSSVPGGTASINSSTGLLEWSVPNTPGLVGQYATFEVRAVDSLGAYSSYRFSVRVTEPNVAPVIATIPNQTISAGASFRYDVTASDANAGDRLTYGLDSASIARGMSIDQYGRISWSPATSHISGSPYTVTVTVTDSQGLTDTDDFTLAVTADNADPTVTVVLDRTQVPIDGEVQIVVHALDDVGVTAKALTLVSVTLGGVTTTLNIAIPLSSDGRARLAIDPSYLGVLKFVATATDEAGNVGTSAEVSLTVFDPSDASPPSATILSPAGGATITEPVEIRGTVGDDIPTGLTWQLTATPLDGGETKVVATGSGPITNGVLGRLDPTLLRNGRYRLDLTATDQGNNKTIDSVMIEIEGGLKLGNFSLSFVDLEVPVLGIPLTVTRTYDTLKSDVMGDFGYGWSLDLSNTKIKVDLPDGVDPGLFGYTPFVDGTRVIVTMPDGTTQGFTFYGKPGTTLFGQVLDYVPAFVPDYGVTSELIVSGLSLRKEYSTGEYYDLGSGRTYSPVDPYFGGSYTLKLRNGTELVINAETGDLYQVVDTAGNSITFTGMGIEHSGGRSIQFERDFAGRITALIDPAGNRIEYSYDSKGNLVSVTDRIGATTQFTYLDGVNDPEHYLEEVIDPFGRTAAKSEYDADGRLIRTTDADGKTTEFKWNGDTKIQYVTDQLGNTTVIETDARGNVTRKIDPEGVTQLWTYDSEDRTLSETLVIDEVDSTSNGEMNDLTTRYRYNAAGDLIETIDPRGLAIRSTYNEYGQQASTTDAFGNSNYNTFDERGLLTSVRDRLGNVTNFGYDSSGNVTTVRDDNGNTLVANTYNELGDVLSSTPAVGEATYFAYDVNGNQIASWMFQGEGVDRVQLLHLTEYDGAERVTGTKYFELPNGQHVTEDFSSVFGDSDYDDSLKWSTSATYNLAGQIISSTDQLGRTAINVYDVRGLLIETRTAAIDENGNPVQLVSRNVYDAAERLIASTGVFRLGASEPVEGTITTYDKAGRVVKTERVIGIDVTLVGSGNLQEAMLLAKGTPLASSSTEYDSAGRAVASIDKYGLRSEVAYNAYGNIVERRSQTYDETGSLVWLVSRTVYDEFGRVTLSTDTYQVDANGDPIATVYGIQTLYDGLGRAFKTLRLQGVEIDLINGETALVSAGAILFAAESIYDADGRVVKSIGADGLVNRYEYDSLGRQIAVVGHPLSLEEVGLADHPLASAPNPAVTVSLRSEVVYDDMGRVEIERRNVQQFVRADGSVVIDNSAAQETTYEYDYDGNVTKTIFPDHTFVVTEYDTFGNVVSETNQLGLTRTFEYDAEGRLISATLPEPGPLSTAPVYSYGYDEAGNQTLIVDPLGRETRFTYDDQGRQLTRTLPLGFGVDGILGTSDDPSSASEWTETFQYDAQGRQILHISFEGVVTEFVYNDALDGRLAEQRFFDNLAQYDDGEGTPSDVWTFSYDAFGRMIEAAKSASGRVEASVFDAQGRLVQLSTAEGILVYEYDDLGRKTSTKVFAADAAPVLDDPVRMTSYTYDELGRLKTVAEDVDISQPADEQTTTYFYDLVGNLDATVLSNGVIEDYVYDEMNRLDLQRTFIDDGSVDGAFDENDTVIATYDYTVRADGKQVGLTEVLSTSSGSVANVYSWEYDDLGRLIEEVIDSTDNARDVTISYSYDQVGNRHEKKVDYGSDSIIEDVITSTFDANDRLLSEAKDTDGLAGAEVTTTYTYDKTQQAGKTETRADGVTVTTNTFDLQGRLASVTIENRNASNVLQSRTVNTYDYDTSGIRIGVLTEIDSTGDGVFETRRRVESLVDPKNFTAYQQTIRETEYDADTEVVKKTVDYTFGHDEISQRTVEYDVSGLVITDTALHFGHDGHGSVRVLLDAAAVAVQFFVYEAYGALQAIYSGSGSFASADSADALTNLLYSGEKMDPLTGMQYLRARYYDPSSGRFNTLDPFFGNLDDPQSFHKYLYTHADPVNGWDPTGWESLGSVSASAGISGGMQATTGASVAGAGYYASLALRIIEASETVILAVQGYYSGGIMGVVQALVGLDIDEYKDMINKLKSQGITSGNVLNGLMSAALGGMKPIYLDFDVPKRGKLGRVLSRVTTVLGKMGDGVQETIGEIGAGLLAKVLGFTSDKLPAFPDPHGPDMFMRQQGLPVWAMIEAKGGSSKLADTKRHGMQMGYKWIGYWYGKLADNNQRDNSDLWSHWGRMDIKTYTRRGYTNASAKPIVTAVVNLNLNKTKDQLSLGLQAWTNDKVFWDNWKGF